MAEWGPGPFDNDAALDWFADVEQLDDAEVPVTLGAALERALEADAAHDDRRVGLAAVVLTAHGCARAVRAGQPEVDAWLAAHRPAVDRALADRALELLDRPETAAGGLPPGVRAALEAGPATDAVRPMGDGDR